MDPHQGIQDLIGKKLRAVGEADKRFTEDALRILRGMRLVSVLNEKLKKGNSKKSSKNSVKTDEPLQLFDFVKETWKAIKTHHALVGKVAKERIREELVKAFSQGNPFGFVSFVDEAGLLPLLFPALAKTKNVEQPVRFHPFDVYAHTLLTLFSLQQLNDNYLVRFAMLYHDVGKVAQFAAYGEDLSKDEIRDILAGPLNHRRGSGIITKDDFSALGFSKKEIDEIIRYVDHHHKLEEILYALPEKWEKKIRVFLSEAGIERFRNILDVTMADRLGQYNPVQNSSDLNDVQKVKTMMEAINKKEGQFTIKDLAVDGNDIIKHFKVLASPAIGAGLKKALHRVLEDIPARNTKEAIYEYLEPIFDKF